MQNESARLHRLPRQRLAHIDGLRAIAVLSVIAFHAALSNRGVANAPHTIVTMLLRQGSHGVDLFFVLSGFCLAYPTLKRIHTSGNADFDVLSLRRATVDSHTASVRCLHCADLGRAPSALRFALSAAPRACAARRIVRGDRVAGVVFRSRAVAERLVLDAGNRISLVFRLPGLALRVDKIAPAFAFIAIGAPMLAFLTRAGGVDFATLPAFMLGIVAAHVDVTRDSRARFAPAAFVTLLALALLSNPWPAWGYSLSPLWQLAAFAFVVSAGSVPFLAKLLSARCLASIGVFSYGIYLVHEPVVGVLNRALSAQLPPYAALALAGAGALGAGMAFSVAAERPFFKGRLRAWSIAAVRSALAAPARIAGIPQVVAMRTSGPAGAFLQTIVDDLARDAAARRSKEQVSGVLRRRAVWGVLLGQRDLK